MTGITGVASRRAWETMMDIKCAKFGFTGIALGAVAFQFAAMAVALIVMAILVAAVISSLGIGS